MRFPAKHALTLSNVTVLTDRPLVDWYLILMMEPLTVAGALVDAFLNELLPEAVLVVSLVALLSSTAHTRRWTWPCLRHIFDLGQLCFCLQSSASATTTSSASAPLSASTMPCFSPRASPPANASGGRGSSRFGRAPQRFPCCTSSIPPISTAVVLTGGVPLVLPTFAGAS